VLSEVEGGVRIDQVGEGSIAAQAGLRGTDVILTIAGRKPAVPGDVAAIIARQAPGTWLPLRIRRSDAELDIVAKFPSATQ
jgi:S1-C subfamily serine protease